MQEAGFNRSKSPEMNTSKIIRIFGNDYLMGRKVSLLTLGYLAIRDALLRVLFGKAVKQESPQLEKGWLVVSKIDHIGDLLMITPFLKEVKCQRPNLQIALLIGRWNRSLGEFLLKHGYCDRLILFDAFFCNRSGSKLRNSISAIRDFFSAWRVLKKMAPQAFVDLRPFSPNTLLLARLANIQYRVGFGLRGLSFTIHAEMTYRPDEPLGQLFLDGLNQLAMQPIVYAGPALPSILSPGLKEKLPSTPYVVVHLSSIEEKRNISPSAWSQVFDELRGRKTIILVGGANDALLFEKIRCLTDCSSIVSLIQKTSMEELLACVEASTGMIGVDSMIAHIACAYHKPTLIIMVKDISNYPSFPKIPSLQFLSLPEEQGRLKEKLRGFQD